MDGGIGARAFAVAIVRKCRDQGACLDVIAGKPAGVHFDDAGSGNTGMVQFKGAFLHRDNLRDATARIDKGRIQINQGVFHPHGGGTRCGKNKEHAVIGRKIGAVHQTGAVLN